MAQIAPPDFKLERYFAQYEFNTKYMLSCSDPEPMSMSELLTLADPQCQQLWAELSLGYTESTGHPLLRKEVAKLHGVELEHTLGVVPQEGIYMAMRVVTNLAIRRFGESEPHAIVTYPGYQSLYENLQTLGCKVSKWTTTLGKYGWTFDLQELRSMFQKNTRIVVVNFPHNPTGYLPSAETWNEIIDICKEKDVYLFSDEMYSLTNNDGSEPNTSACSLYKNAVSLFGLSKTFGLPGLRVGWLCTQNEELMTGLQSYKDYLTICSSAPSEILAVIALRNKEKLVKRTMGTLVVNLKIFKEFVARYPDYFEWKQPRACTTSLLVIKPGLLAHFDGNATTFCDACRTSCGVLFVPGSMYDFTDNCVRLGFGRKNFPEALQALGGFLDSFC